MTTAAATVARILALPLALLAGVYIGEAAALSAPAKVERTYQIVQELGGQAFIVDHDLSAADCALELPRYPSAVCMREI